jgi:hypothetical protein
MKKTIKKYPGGGEVSDSSKSKMSMSKAEKTAKNTYMTDYGSINKNSKIGKTVENARNTNVSEYGPVNKSSKMGKMIKNAESFKKNPPAGFKNGGSVGKSKKK